MASWEVTLFEIKTESGGDEGQLYANGLHQFKLNIFIKAVKPKEDDSDENEPYQLTSQELRRTELVGVNREPLPKEEWWWSFEKNKFANALPRKARENDLSNPPKDEAGKDNLIADPPAQVVELYVMSKEIHPKNIQARIRQPNGDYAYTTDSGQGNSVTLTGLAPVTYTRDQISAEKSNVKDGKWQKVSLGQNTDVANWDQDNWYISISDGYRTAHAEIHSYDSTGSGNGRISDNKLRMAWRWHIHNNHLNVFYIWEYGAEFNREVGYGPIMRMETPGFGIPPIPVSYKPYKSVTVNQRADTLCITHVRFNDVKKYHESPHWYYDTWFDIFDIYGNSGRFRAVGAADAGSVRIDPY